MKLFAHIGLDTFTIYTSDNGWLASVSTDLLNKELPIEEAIQDWADAHYGSDTYIDAFVYGTFRRSVQVVDIAGREVLRFERQHDGRWIMRGGPIGGDDHQMQQLVAATTYCRTLQRDPYASRPDMVQTTVRR